MSGHSKWATIKRAKAVNDAKRGAIFTKLANLITIAAKEKGGDPETNFSLRMAIDKAKAANMPKDNIDRAIKRGTGELEGAQIEELIYEGMGPANSQWIVRCLTDNKNRTASEVRHVFTKFGGSLSPVMWNFEMKGIIRIAKMNLEELELELIDAGADDIQVEEENTVISTAVADLHAVKDLLEAKGATVESAEIEYVAKDTQEVNSDEEEKIEKFVEAMEDLEDVSDYFTNINF